jgi:replicative DNA helicase
MNDKLTGDFILQLFHSCVINRTIFELVVENVKENWLPEEKQRKYLSELHKLKEKGAKKIMWSVFELEFRKEKNLKDYAKQIQDYDLEYNEELMIQTLEEFIKNSKFIELYDKTYEIYNTGDKSKAYKLLISKADDLSKFSLTGVDDLMSVFGDFNKRNTERIIDKSINTIEKFPFGIDELDRITHGGCERGEFIMFVGDAKSGKSICLIHCGINAARRGVGVLHFQLEGTKKQVMQRYDSSWSGSFYYDVKEAQMADSKFEDHKKIVSKLGKTDIWIDCPEKFLARSVVDIRRKIIEVKKTRKLGVVIVDYLDLANPDGEKYSSGDERHRQQKASRMLKDLAVEQDIAIITATQSSSISKELLDDPDFVITREHLAEDKGKVRPVDMLISINRTPDERKTKIARLYCDALREHDSGQVIKIKQNLSRTRFYDRKATLNLIMDEE